MKTNLIRGRTFNEFDGKDAPPVVIVDQTLAASALPALPPTRNGVMIDPDDDNGAGERLYETIGVVP